MPDVPAREARSRAAPTARVGLAANNYTRVVYGGMLKACLAFVRSLAMPSIDWSAQGGGLEDGERGCSDRFVVARALGRRGTSPQSGFWCSAFPI